MPIPAAVRAILGNVWASTAGALKQDPADADPAIVRADGYPASFSSTLVPEQETIQGRWNEFDSAIDDIYTSGVPFYDALIDYPADAMTNEDGVLYSALIANGPGTSNAIAPSADTAGTTWGRVSGTQGAPSAPAQPTATSPAPGTLDVSWNCPLDGGSVITGFELQYKNAGTSWSTAQDVATTVPFAQLTGLTNGQALEFRVRATNSIDTSPWSATGTGTPTAAAPSGGSTLGTDRAGRRHRSLPLLAGTGHGRRVHHRLPRAVAHQRAGVLQFSRQASVTTDQLHADRPHERDGVFLPREGGQQCRQLDVVERGDGYACRGRARCYDGGVDHLHVAMVGYRHGAGAGLWRGRGRGRFCRQQLRCNIPAATVLEAPVAKVPLRRAKAVTITAVGGTGGAAGGRSVHIDLHRGNDRLSPTIGNAEGSGGERGVGDSNDPIDRAGYAQATPANVSRTRTYQG